MQLKKYKIKRKLLFLLLLIYSNRPPSFIQLITENLRLLSQQRRVIENRDLKNKEQNSISN